MHRLLAASANRRVQPRTLPPNLRSQTIAHWKYQTFHRSRILTNMKWAGTSTWTLGISRRHLNLWRLDSRRSRRTTSRSRATVWHPPEQAYCPRAWLSWPTRQSTDPPSSTSWSRAKTKWRRLYRPNHRSKSSHPTSRRWPRVEEPAWIATN